MTTEFLLDDWKKIPARHIFQFTRGYAISRADMGSTGIPCVHYGDIHGEYGFEVDLHTAKLGRVSEPANYDVHDFISKGQFLFAGSSEDYKGSGNFTLIQGAQRGIAGTDTIVLTPKIELPSRFIAYLFDSLFFREQIRPHMMGTKVFHPSQKVIKNAICFLPPKHMADSIAAYLDEKTTEIDALIDKLTRQMELLNRHRRELIARTVTRGLDPNAPMRDSGIEWIAESPAAWKTTTISIVTDENKAKNTDLSEKNLLSLSYGRIIRKDIDLAFGLLPASFDSYQIVEPGYIVLRMTDLQNDKRSLRSALSDERGIITSAYIGLKVRGPISSGYFAWLLRFYDLAKVFYSLGGGVRQSANYKEIGKIPILVPPIAEQQKIADFLEEKSAQIDLTIVHINRQIDLLGKYRKQVINDAVTGKVHVGEVA